MVQFDSLVYGAFTRRFRRGVGGTVGRNWAGRNLDIIQGMEMRRYRNGSHQVRVNAPRPFRHARRIQKLANSAEVFINYRGKCGGLWENTTIHQRDGKIGWRRMEEVCYEVFINSGASRMLRML